MTEQFATIWTVEFPYLAPAIISVVAFQRAMEMVLSNHNTRQLLKRGAFEVGARHYPLIIALHAAWLATALILADPGSVQIPWLLLYILLQAARAWTLMSLGDRWTTRIMVVPGESPVRHGPYRYLRHPNYLIVACEIAVLPLALGLPWVALIFSVLNGIAMLIRIPVENQALQESGNLKSPCN